MDRRLDFIRKWYKRGCTAGDPFERFFCLWISLIVATQRFRTRTGRFPKDDTDAKRVTDYFKYNEEEISIVLERKHDEMSRLARKRGARYGDSIVDTGSESLRTKFRKLSDHYIKGVSLSNADHVQYVAEMLNKIRNNVFHGVKVYDDREDLDILGLINPILAAVIEACEAVASPVTALSGRIRSMGNVIRRRPG